MLQAVFPGTFDPPNLGHLDMIRRASKLFQPLYVAVGCNRLKVPPVFTLEERLDMLRKMTVSIPHIKIVSFDGLLVDFVTQLGINVIIRSVRSWGEFESEIVQAYMNRMMIGIETIYLNSDERYKLISSSLVKEIARQGKRLHDFVPAELEEMIFYRLFQEFNEKM